MHNRVRQYTCILFLAVSLCSCKKYLDKKSDASLNVPSTVTDLQALLDMTFAMNQAQTPSFGEASCDDYFLTPEAYASIPVERQTIYTWNRMDYNYLNDWSQAYLAVYNSNYSLDRLAELSRTPVNAVEYDNVKGSALFFRSFNLLNLMWVHAHAFDESTADTDLGVALRLNSDLNVPSVRSSVRKCYEQIISDARNSIQYLPQTAQHVFRPSRTAAYGLLARTFLSMRIYDSAYKYADLCLQDYNILMDYNDDPEIDWANDWGSPFKRFNKETIFYTEMNTNLDLHTPFYAKVDTVLYSMFTDDDLRRPLYFLPAGDYYTYRGSYTRTDYLYFTGLATDEIYLLRAESNARLGKINEAMDDLNTLLVKRFRNTVPFVPVSATDQADAINKILDERRKELCMRGIRWMDIKRLNKEGRNITLRHVIDDNQYELSPNDPYHALPLPDDVIKKSGMPQNKRD